jgi:hypothetical protein
VKHSSRWIALVLIAGSLLGTQFLTAQDEDKKDLAALQGKWQDEGKDQTGAEFRVVKTVEGNRETLQTFRDGELIHAHIVDFKLRRTDEVRIFTYSNMIITAGPNKGEKKPDEGSYIYQVRGDQWITIEGMMNADDDRLLPAVTAYTRVKPREKKTASATPAQSASDRGS